MKLLTRLADFFDDMLMQESYFSVWRFFKSTNYADYILDILEENGIQYCIDNNIPISYAIINEKERTSAGYYSYYWNDNKNVPLEINVNYCFFTKEPIFIKDGDKVFNRSRIIHTLYHEIGHHIAITNNKDTSEESANWEGMKLASSYIDEIDIILLNIRTDMFSDKDENGSKLLFKSKKYKKQFRQIKKRFGY